MGSILQEISIKLKPLRYIMPLYFKDMSMDLSLQKYEEAFIIVKKFYSAEDQVNKLATNQSNHKVGII